jgi:hypothetical protein
MWSNREAPAEVFDRGWLPRGDVIQKQQESKIRSARVLDGGFSFIVLSERYALQNAVKLSRPGRGWPSSTDTSACHAKGQKD